MIINTFHDVGCACQAVDEHDEEDEGNHAVHKTEQNTYKVSKMGNLFIP